MNAIVYIVDDDSAARDSLKWLLISNGYQVSEHENAERFLRALDATENSVVCCAFVDVQMSGMSGIELQKVLLKHIPYIPLCFITGHANVSIAVIAMKNGAVDFIQKPYKKAEIFDLADKMLKQSEKYNTELKMNREIKNKMRTLTPREMDVLNVIVQGKSNREISEELGISVKTIEAHRASLMDKLDVRRPISLLKIAFSYMESKKSHE